MKTLLSLISLIAISGSPPVQQSRTELRPLAGVPTQKKRTRDIKVFKLENAIANEVVGAVLDVVPGITLGTDPRTNSVIATGLAEELAVLEALLLRLDKDPRQAEDKTELRVIELKFDGSRVERTLNELVPNGARIVFDARSNSLICSARPEQLNMIQQLVRVLDVPDKATKIGAGHVKLRVIWLMNDTTGKPPGADLKPVVNSLGAIGIDGLKVVAQSLVHVEEPGSQFDVVGSVGDDERVFEISGQRGVVSDGPIRIDLRIQAQPEGQERPVGVEAAVTLASGQTAVLGVTQAGKANSAFVVQLVEGL